MKTYVILLYVVASVLYCGLVEAGSPNSAKADIYSSASVWKSGEENDELSAWRECDGPNCVLAFMKKSGASEESMNFVRKIDGEGYLETFEEKGRVDIGHVAFPARANTNEAYVFLNGSPSFISTELGWHALDISRDPNYSKLKKQYPELQVWPAGARFISVGAGSHGGQRFIFSYYLVNGCHACGVDWVARVAFDFSRDGKFKGIKVLKLIPPEVQVTKRQSAWAPSFDCAKATTSPERMICSNKELAQADIRMVQIYKAVRNNSPNKEVLTREQNNWRKNVRDACADATCMLRAYQDRIIQLSR